MPWTAAPLYRQPLSLAARCIAGKINRPDSTETEFSLAVKIKVWHKQFLRFCVVGVASTSAYLIASTILLVGFDKSLIVANLGGFFAAAIISYLGNALWSFETTGEARSFLKFLVLCAVVFVTSVVISNWVTRTGLPQYYGILLTAGIIPFISFGLQKLWVFQK